MAGTAYFAFGGSATVTLLIDHFCALVHNYRGREMRPVLETRGIQSASGFKLATSPIPTESSSNSSLHEE
jgi:hypothetical protein